MPLGVPFVRRKRQNLKEMAVRVSKVKRLNPAGVLIPIGKTLRAGRRVPDLILAEPFVSTIHVACDDRDVLEPAIIRTAVDWRRPAARRQELGQLDELVAQTQAGDSHP